MTNKVSKRRLFSAIRRSWRLDTCHTPMKKDYRKHKKSYGQCHCTALIINDYFGGKLLEYKFPEGGGHFCNFIDGKMLDLTRDQFEPTQKFPKPKILRRNQTKNTRSYFLLKKRTEKLLKNSRAKP